MKLLDRFLSLPRKATIATRWLGFTKIPLLFFVRPSVVSITDESIVVKIRLRRRTRNHLGSMYFGALAVGADVAAGLIAWRRIDESGEPIALVFKDIHGNFLRRPDADVHFTCTQGSEIDNLVKRAVESGEREEMPVHVAATVPDLSGDEPVAEFTLTLSIKKKPPRE